MYAPMAQSAERKSHNLKVVRLSLTVRSLKKNFFLLYIELKILKKIYEKKLQAKKL